MLRAVTHETNHHRQNYSFFGLLGDERGDFINSVLIQHKLIAEYLITFKMLLFTHHRNIQSYFNRTTGFMFHHCVRTLCGVQFILSV